MHLRWPVLFARNQLALLDLNQLCFDREIAGRILPGPRTAYGTDGEHTAQMEKTIAIERMMLFMTAAAQVQVFAMTQEDVQYVQHTELAKAGLTKRWQGRVHRRARC